MNKGSKLPRAQHAKSLDSRKYSLWNFWVCSLAFKILLIPGYFSTDFEVHRNWLALTNKLPLKQWYVEHTSQWTLDYPPFFAYFEWLLSQFVPAKVRENGCLDLVEIGQFGMPTVVFQRITVIISEILLFVVLQIYINKSAANEKSASFVVASSIVLSPGFIIIDHIHFQYNGFLFAMLIGAIVAAKHKRYLVCAACFTTALCFKHIFLYLAPSFFAFLLRAYVLDFGNFKFKSYNDLIWLVRWPNLFKLGSVVMVIFAVCLAPFYSVMPNLLTRLFPFSRGLTHAYWAPNFWALYSFVDKVLTFVFLKVPYVHNFLSRFISPPLIPATIEQIKEKLEVYNVGTRGLVQDVYFVILPQVQPKLTFLLTLFYQVLAVIPVLFHPSFKRFVGSLTLCGFASFLFGWHVHEKAIMLVIIPFSFLVTSDRRLISPFRLLAAAGYVSLFPLLYESQNFLIKLLYSVVWAIIYFFALKQTTKVSSSVRRRVFFLDRLALFYIVMLIPMVIGVELLNALQWKYKLLQKFEFAGLVIYSIYCSIGILCSWMGLSWLYNFDEPLWQ
ncbi:LAMI_0H09846g1_1 [Lachancea mirantina]|uniref:Alpha-1,3-glucosyltransferase n=1 Tax=Lachancea mirantina TaxID=1230905 RepID=A0A1G4KGS7_9SACH|nr:LAMI_0H09846g1_1 [Lachancea mirantina]